MVPWPRKGDWRETGPKLASNTSNRLENVVGITSETGLASNWRKPAQTGVNNISLAGTRSKSGIGIHRCTQLHGIFAREPGHHDKLHARRHVNSGNRLVACLPGRQRRNRGCGTTSDAHGIRRIIGIDNIRAVVVRFGFACLHKVAFGGLFLFRVRTGVL